MEFQHEIRTEIDIEIEAHCTGCGSLLTLSLGVNDGRRGPHIVRVEPCEVCLDAAHRGGYDDGRREGYEEGRDDATD